MFQETCTGDRPIACDRLLSSASFYAACLSLSASCFPACLRSWCCGCCASSCWCVGLGCVRVECGGRWVVWQCCTPQRSGARQSSKPVERATVECRVSYIDLHRPVCLNQSSVLHVHTPPLSRCLCMRIALAQDACDARRVHVLEGVMTCNAMGAQILVLVNDADWELCGALDYVLRPNDSLCFISTLHGG